jgi:integral membrane sensor domain MASE1
MTLKSGQSPQPGAPADALTEALAAAAQLAPGEIAIQIVLRCSLAETLRKHASRLKREPAVLFADIVEAVLGDDLVQAVLDE